MDAFSVAHSIVSVAGPSLSTQKVLISWPDAALINGKLTSRIFRIFFPFFLI